MRCGARHGGEAPLHIFCFSKKMCKCACGAAISDGPECNIHKTNLANHVYEGENFEMIAVGFFKGAVW